MQLALLFEKNKRLAKYNQYLRNYFEYIVKF